MHCEATGSRSHKQRGIMSSLSDGKVKPASFSNPYFYRFAVGDAPATMVSDGPLPVGAHTSHYANVTAEEMEAILDANFIRKDKMVLEQNVLVIETGGKTVLFDTGVGTLERYGPTSGQLMNTLAAANIDPASIDAVVISHAHPDHVSGIMKADGTRNFPNAQYYINEADFNFWTDPAKPSGPKVDTARNNLLPNRNRIVFIKDGQEFIPGVTGILAPGHSVGHMMFMIQSGNGQLCYTADLAHQYAIQLEMPLSEFLVDTDPAQMAQTRLKHLTILAEGRIPMLGYHFPWPGIGHVVRFGDGFRFVPSAMQMISVP
jgi:glyoxylase-like metal-dependent hydrolase (beta-lactamase superfamily II)